jgi:hypothetical protein
MRVTEDIVIGSLLSESKDDNRRTRVIRFEDVTGPDYLATVANSPLCPKKGNGFPPGRGYTGAVVDRSFKHPGNKKSVVIATIVYSNKATANDGGSSGDQSRRLIDVSLNGSPVSVVTEFDYRGRPMNIAYSAMMGTDLASDYPINDKNDPATHPDFDIMPYRTQDLDFMSTLEFTFEELGNPGRKQRKHMNTTNLKPWQGEKQGTWLCEIITGSTRLVPISGSSPELESPLLWTVKYVFRFNPKGWLKLGIYKSQKNNGAVPKNLDLPPIDKIDYAGRKSEKREPAAGAKLEAGTPHGNGWAMFRIKGESDFNALKLPDIQRS